MNQYRVGIISGTPGFEDQSGRIWVNHAIGRLFDLLIESLPNPAFCIPILKVHQPNKMTYAVNGLSTRLTKLPPMRTTIEAQRTMWRTRTILKQFAKSVDVLFIRLPFQVPNTLTGLDRPKVIHVVGNPTEIVRQSTDYSGFGRMIANRYAQFSENTMRRLVLEQNTRAMSNGEEMWNVLGCLKGRICISSCLSESEIPCQVNIKPNCPPKLLFVGYLRPEKGCLTLIDAFDEVRQKRELRLSLVGGADRDTEAGRLVQDRVARSPFYDDIELPGIIPFGPSLFEYYSSHDIFVLPSLSEGTPRTIVEARAFGCPVIASSVGGVPNSINHGIDGVLVPPANSRELAKAIESLLDNESYRTELIEAGFRRAKSLTIENFVEQIVEELELVVSNRTAEGKRNI